MSPLTAATKFYREGLKIAKLQSPVEIVDVKGEPVDPSVGSQVKPGSRIKTGNGALCVLASNDGDNMVLDEDTEISILSPGFANAKQASSVSLAQGRAHFQVKHNPNFPMKVRTAVNMLTVRGTHFSTIVQGEVFRLEVLEGLVEARFFDDPDQVISTAAGKMLDARGGVKMSGTMTDSKKASMQKVKSFGDKAAASVMGEAAQQTQQNKQEQESEKSSQSDEILEELGETFSDIIQEIEIIEESREDTVEDTIDIEFEVDSGETVGD